MSCIFLHYELKIGRKYYRGREIQLDYNEKPANGYLCRDSSLAFGSHTGTHVDFPAHFIEKGKFGNEYPCDYLFSDNVFVSYIDLLSLNKGRLEFEDLYLSSVSQTVEILLIKTGYCDIRDDDKYWADSPIVSADLPLKLKERFPALKAVVFDIISVKSLRDSDEGVQCHLNFLSERGGREVLIIEDADFSKLKNDTKIKSIKIVPFQFERMEGTPCSIIAEI